MTFNEFQKKSARTINPELDGAEDFFHGIFGVVGEIGEMISILQKLYQGHDMDWYHFVSEMGDVLWMLAEICTAIGIDMDDVAQRNIDKLMNRYPDGFDSERSFHRDEGDV